MSGLSFWIWIFISIFIGLIISWLFLCLFNISPYSVKDCSFVSYRTLKRLIEDRELKVDEDGYVYVIDPLASDHKNHWAILMDPITFIWFTFTQENKFNKKLVAPWKRNKEIEK